MNTNDTLTLHRFPIVIESNCQNISRIYPLKQRQVDALHNIAADFDIVRKIYIFGSSVTPKCNIDSDLDICIDADTSDGMKVFDLQKAVGDICDWNCDILMYSNIGSVLKNTIDKEGVVIYEQPAS